MENGTDNISTMSVEVTRSSDNPDSLEDLGLFINLEYLDIQLSYDVSNFRFVNNLRDLKYLSVRSGIAPNLDPLRDLENLEILILGSFDRDGNANLSVNNVDGIAGLSGLKVLELWGIDMPDTSSLERMSSLESYIIYYEGETESGAFIRDGVTSIRDNAFRGLGLESVTIPDSVTSIGAGAFSNNALTNVTIPDGVTSIGDSAFRYNDEANSDRRRRPVSTVTGTSGAPVGAPVGAAAAEAAAPVAEEGAVVVKHVSGIKSVTIPDSVTSIGDEAFSDNALTIVTIPDSVTHIGDYAFSKNALASVTIPNSVTSIGEGAFSENALTSVTIPDGVTSIRGFNNNALTSVTIPNGVTSIGERAFSENSLTSVIIPDSVTSIEDEAFRENSLTSVTIPNSVTSIGDEAFYGNTLISVTIPDSVTSIGANAFAVNDLTSVTIPDSVTDIGYNAFDDDVVIIRDDVIEDNTITSMLNDDEDSLPESIFPPSGEKSSAVSESKTPATVELPEGTTALMPIVVGSMTASSVLDSQKGATGELITYISDNAFDNNVNTVWCEGVSGNGNDEWVQADFSSEVNITELYIKNGYWRTSESLNNNSRIKSLRIAFSDGTYEDFTLTDPASQNYSTMLLTNGEHLTFSEEHQTSYVTLTILDTYEGDSWQDTCLTDVVFYGYGNPTP